MSLLLPAQKAVRREKNGAHNLQGSDRVPDCPIALSHAPSHVACKFFTSQHTMCVSFLQVLSIRDCLKVSDEAIAAVAQHGALEQLDVSALPYVGPATIKALATCCKCAFKFMHWRRYWSRSHVVMHMHSLLGSCMVCWVGCAHRMLHCRPCCLHCVLLCHAQHAPYEMTSTLHTR